MSCSIETKTKQALIDKKVISDTREILDLPEFNRLNELYSNTARNKYNTDIPKNELLFDKELTKSGVYKATANKDYFSKLEDSVAEFDKNEYENKKNIGKQGTLFQINSDFRNLHEAALDSIIDNLTSRFNISIKKVDSKENWAGRYNLDGTIELNINKLKADTPFHEIAHVFIDLIEKNENALFNNLVKQIKAERSILEFIKQDNYYKNLPENEQIKEAIATAIGRYAAQNINPKTGRGLISAIKTLLGSLAKYIKSLIKANEISLPSDFKSSYQQEQLKLGRLKYISPNITLSDFGAFLALGKGKYNLQNNTQRLFNDSKEFNNKHSEVVRDVLSSLKTRNLKDNYFWDDLVRTISSKYPNIFHISKSKSREKQLNEFNDSLEKTSQAAKQNAEREYDSKREESLNQLNFVKQLITYGSNKELLDFVFDNHPNIKILANDDIYNVYVSNNNSLTSENSIFIDKYNKWLSISKQYKTQGTFGEGIGYDSIDESDPNWEKVIAKFQNIDIEENRPKLEQFVKSKILPRFENNYILNILKEDYIKEAEESSRDYFYDSAGVTEDDINHWANEDILKRILFANNIVTSEIFKDSGLYSSLNAYLPEVQELYQKTKKQYDKQRLEEFKERKEKLKAILEFKDLQSELGLDVEEFESQSPEEDDIAAPIPKWFLDMHTIANSGKDFDEVGKGFGGGLAQGLSYLIASEEWDKKLENPQYETFAEKILNSKDLSIFLRDYFYPDYTNPTFSDLEKEYKTKYSINNSENPLKSNQVDYTLKAINLLNTSKAQEIWNKGKKANWDLNKILSELQIPKDQKQIILDWAKDNKPESISDIVTGVLADMSFVVDVNVATEKEGRPDLNTRNRYAELGIDIDQEFEQDIDREKAYGYGKGETNDVPTQHHSNLTVPGGTNYTENSFRVPGVQNVLSTGGNYHDSEFNQSRGDQIGWFRSDDAQNPKKGQYSKELKDNYYSDNIGDNQSYFDNLEEESKLSNPTKTRRILEVQSPFQKSRDKQLLIQFRNDNAEWVEAPQEEIEEAFSKGTPFRSDIFRVYNNFIYDKSGEKASVKSFEEFAEKSNENQFLQLLNKDGNWVPFFIKSIVQDSVKKGYEKVLFPTGDTASKVESHQTLEEFKKQKEDKLKELEANLYYVNVSTATKVNRTGFKTKEEAEKFAKENDSIAKKSIHDEYEIKTLQEELKRVEIEGFGALKPIWEFYENKVKNILDKTYGKENIARIKDEYGNEWFQLDLQNKQNDKEIFLAKKSNRIEFKKLVNGESYQIPVKLQEINQKKQNEKITNSDVIEKLNDIVKKLGIKFEIADLPEHIAAQADMMNRVIKFANGELTEDNFTEEVCHFIVDILQQKKEPIFDKMMSEIWQYPLYKTVRAKYSVLPEYQTKNGSVDNEKIKKEAIGQLLTAKLLNLEEIQDKGFLASAWAKISNFIKELFNSLSVDTRDSFTKVADSILYNPDFIKESDAQFLDRAEQYFAKKDNRLTTSLSKVMKKFGSQNTLSIDSHTQKDIVDLIKKVNEAGEKITITEKDENGEDIEKEVYSFFENLKQRATSIADEATKIVFKNMDQSDMAKFLRESKMKVGTSIHKTIEDILYRYIDPTTNELRESPVARPLNMEIKQDDYNKLETHLVQRIKSYPQGTKFLMETKVVNEKAGYAGTIDFMAITPNAVVDILDWKTTDINYFEHGVKRQRFDISPYNQKYWKVQMNLYKEALQSYGITEFGFTRDIPIAIETEKKLIDKTKGYGPDNVLVNVKSLEIGDLDTKKIPTDKFYLVPVTLDSESTGNNELDKVIDKLIALRDRIENTVYKKEEAYKKYIELNKLNTSIRELQVKQTANLFTAEFNENFKRFRSLGKVSFDFLDNLEEGQRVLTETQTEEISQYFNDVFKATEFLDSFSDFPVIIADLFKAPEENQSDQIIKERVLALQNDLLRQGANASKISQEIVENCMGILDKFAKLYKIDAVTSRDNPDTGGFLKFFTAVLNRDESSGKSVAFAARLLNAMKIIQKEKEYELFNELTGEFSLVFDKIKAKTSLANPLSKVYEKVLEKDEKGKPIRTLLSKLDKGYKSFIKEQNVHYDSLYESLSETLSESGLKGDKLFDKIKKDYRSSVIDFLKENYNLTEFDKNYEKVHKAYIDSLVDLNLDEDPFINEQKKKDLLRKWEKNHDIYTSPDALSTKNFMLNSVINGDKWNSKGYKELEKPENKDVLDMYNLFQKLNDRARKNGMLEDIYGYKEFLPYIDDPSQFKSVIKTLKNGSFGLFYVMKALKPKKWNSLFNSSFEAITEDIDPVTNKARRTIPIHYKYLETPNLVKKKGESDIDFAKRKKLEEESIQNTLSTDLFYVYKQWADHIIKYETLTSFESRLKMAQFIESRKQEINQTDSKGHIVINKDAKNKANRLSFTTKEDRTTETFLTNLIDRTVYGRSDTIKDEYKMFYDALYGYTAAKGLGLNISVALLHPIRGSLALQQNLGKWIGRNEIITGLALAAGVNTKTTSSYGKDLVAKSKFLVERFNAISDSSYERKNTEKYDSSLRLNIYGLIGKTDELEQRGIANAVFMNTTIKDGKFVNIRAYVKSLYDSKIQDTSLSNKERTNLRNKRDAEISKMCKEQNLFTFVEKSGNGFKINGVDFGSVQGKSENIKLQNAIDHYIKNSRGNTDEYDKSQAQMIYWMKFILQFKGFMPSQVGSYFTPIRYQYQLDDMYWGKWRVFWDSFSNQALITVGEYIKSMAKLLPFMNKDLKGVNITEAAKDAYYRKKEEMKLQNKKFVQNEAQFVDMYLNQLENQFRQFNTILILLGIGAFLGYSYAHAQGDKKKAWYYKVLSMLLAKLFRGYSFTLSIHDLLTFIGDALPVFKALQDVANVIYSVEKFGKGVITRNPKLKKEAHVYDKTMKAIPVAREAHMWSLSLSEKYDKWVGVRKPQVKF